MEFAFVHGSYHGAWCWDLLRPQLEQLGHRVVTMDLPISDPTCGAVEYADAVEAALDPGSVPVLVGHSMGGLVTPIVASRRPIHSLVFLAAFLPSPGRSANDQRTTEPIDGLAPPATAEWTDHGQNVWMVGPNTASELFFHDVPASLAAWAIERLRPQAYDVLREITPLTAWPDVARHSIVCRDDRAINPDWVRTAARERLDTEAIEIDGGHSPFLTRPAELAQILHGLA